MPPEPLYPDAPMANTDGHHRWWIWDGHVVTLKPDDGEWNPPLVAEAILAHRDASTDEERDVAVYLVWVVESHPTWDGGCPTCHTDKACDEQWRANGVALEFLIRKSTELVRRSKANIARFDEKRGAA